VTIDEYDASIMRIAWNPDFYRSTTHNPEIENSFKRFFSSLKKANKKKVSVFITGVSPISLTTYTCGWNHATNISQLPQFVDLYGFNVTDIERGLRMIQPPLPESIIKKTLDYCTVFNGYRFHPYQPDNSRIFNPGKIVSFLMKLSHNWKFAHKETLSETQLFERLINITDDIQYKPAEDTLASVRHHPFAGSVMVSLLEKPDAAIHENVLTDITFDSMKTRLGLISYM
jgi:hypothetical protein